MAISRFFLSFAAYSYTLLFVSESLRFELRSEKHVAYRCVVQPIEKCFRLYYFRVDVSSDWLRLAANFKTDARCRNGSRPFCHRCVTREVIEFSRVDEHSFLRSNRAHASVRVGATSIRRSNREQDAESAGSQNGERSTSGRCLRSIMYLQVCENII